MPTGFGGQSQQRWGDNTLNQNEYMRDVQMLDTSGRVCATGDVRRKGGMVLLTFVDPSAHETEWFLKALQTLSDAYKASGKVTVWAVSPLDADATIAYGKSIGVMLPFLLDRDRYHAMTYGLTTLPTTYLADSAGVIVRKGTGFPRELLNDLSARVAAFAGVDVVDLFAPPAPPAPVEAPPLPRPPRRPEPTDTTAMPDAQDPLDFDLSGTTGETTHVAASPVSTDPQASTAAFQAAVLRRMTAEREAMAAKTPRQTPIVSPAPLPVLPVSPESPSVPFAATLPMTIGSLALSLVLEALAYGWPFAVGLTAMIFVHECGHAVAARHFRRPYGGMYFMPFLGAAVRLRGRSGGPAEEATIGIMGPIFGGFVGLVFLAAFFALHLHILLTLAKISFGINFINLMPVPPLDGSWIAPILRKKVEQGRPLPASPATRLRFGLLYGGLMALLVAAFFWSESLAR